MKMFGKTVVKLDDAVIYDWISAMKNKVISILGGICLVAFLCGCVSTVDGRHHAAMPLVKDKMVSLYPRPVDQIFAAAQEVLKEMGSLFGENNIRKSLEAKVDTRTVWVLVEEYEPTVSRLTVQVRTKGGGSDKALASEIDKRIALKLK
jgi:hypothetical protein